MTNLLQIDFNTLYKEQKAASSFKPKSKEEWNGKAADMDSVVKNDVYIDELLKHIDTKKCHSLLDVGCGAGTVCINLRDAFKKITAIDYSEAMIEKLKERIKNEKAKNIMPMLKAWEDDWSELGQFDVVVASRSMQVGDMREALEKLNAIAKKRVYITTKVGGSFLPPEISSLLDNKIMPNPDYIYIVNILYAMGINPKLDYIELKDNRLPLKTEEGFLNSVRWSIGELSENEEDNIREFYRSGAQTLKPKIKWALISWNK